MFCMMNLCRTLVFVVLFYGCYQADTFNVPKQTVVRPTGVITQPNELGELPPGSLAVGDNIMIRRQGVIEPRVAFEVATTEPTDRQLVKFTDSIDLASGFDYFAVGRKTDGSGQLYGGAVSSGSNPLTLSDGVTPIAFSAGKAQFSRARDRLIMSNDISPAVLKGGSSTNATQAGLTMPSMVVVQSTAAGATIPDTKFTAYRAVFRRVDSDGYSKRGAPSPAFGYENSTGGDVIPTLRVYWDTTEARINGGDLLELYRVELQDDPDLLGDRFRFAFSYTISNTDAANGYADVVDRCLDASLDADLYTNGDEDGLTNANFMPPTSSDVATFKKATFYTTESLWHERAVQVPYQWGALDTAAEIANGIGFSDHTGTWGTGVTTITSASSGLAIGQVLNHATFQVGTTITNIAGTTITISLATTGSGTGATFGSTDVIEIDGIAIQAPTYQNFLLNLAELNASGDTPVVGIPSTIAPQNYGSSNQPGVTITFLKPVPGYGPFTIRASNGSHYSPPLPNMNETAESSKNDPRTNRVHFSKIDQPEALPPSNFLLVGEGQLLKLFPLSDSMLVWATDGLFRISGDGDDWAVSPVDQNAILVAPDAVTSLNGSVFALIKNGLARFEEGSNAVTPFSTPIIGEDLRLLLKQMDGLDTPPPFTWNVSVVADEYRNEVWVNFYDLDDADPIQTYIWNTDTNTFSTHSAVTAAGVGFLPSAKNMILGYEGSVFVYDVDEESWSFPTLVFNPVTADDPGVLKQWIDVTLFLEDLTATAVMGLGGDGATVVPSFNGENYPFSYVIPATSGAFDHVIAPTGNSCHDKQMKLGLAFDGPGLQHWELKGLTYRYRLASETLRN